MNPRTHPRGAPPDFSMTGLPPNPNPQRITSALWWLVCMRDRLEPLSQNGGVFANKAGYHNAGQNLPNHGLGNAKTDHSIRRAPDRAGAWWQTKAAAHDWTFDRAHTKNYTEINKYMKRRVDAMRSLTDLRPDNVYAYTIGNLDGDSVVEGWNEYKDAPESGDSSHLWHIHDSFRRNIVGSFPHMWMALTIDMGWTYAEWQRSVTPRPAPKPPAIPIPPLEASVALELNSRMWPKPTPEWAKPYEAMLKGPDGVTADPTFLNGLLHTLRHASEASRQAANNGVTLAAIQSEVSEIRDLLTDEDPPPTPVDAAPSV